MELCPVELSYEEHGQGLPLLLLHGFPLNRSIWQPVLPFLTDHARVILPDLRGHGQSPSPEGVYSMREMAEDIYQLIERLEIDRVVMAGHSLGGYVALSFAQAYPQKLAGLALIASHPAADRLEKRQSRRVTARRLLTKGLDKLAENMPAQLTDQPELAAEIAGMISTGSRQGFAGSLLGMAIREDATGSLASINVPTVVIAGAKDKIVPLEVARTYVQFFPRGWLVEAADAGHMPMMESPQVVAKALQRLIRHAKNGNE